MSTEMDAGARTRSPLTRDRVLQTAVELADRNGIDSISMRKLADALGVVPMALYRHVANKDELLGGMIDVVVGEIDPPRTDTDWKTVMREPPGRLSVNSSPTSGSHPVTTTQTPDGVMSRVSARSTRPRA
jgi:AcrR family transcriptional regulator